MNAEPVSKRTRFEVFKRDGFRCQYCGKKPPEVTLEVDHIIPRCRGGTNAKSNLLTSCFDCNRGKSGVPLSEVPETHQAAIQAAIEERRAHVQRLTEVAKLSVDEVKAEMQALDTLAEYWGKLSDINGDPYTGSAYDLRQSVHQFLRDLSVAQIAELMRVAFKAPRVPNHRRFKYFCGCCWRTIKGDLKEHLMNNQPYKSAAAEQGEPLP